MAVALPLAIAPMKAGAQQITKEVKPSTVFNTRLGLGYGFSQFCGQPIIGPKAIGNVNLRTKNVVASIDAVAGPVTQDFKANVGVPVYKGKKVSVDAGAVGRYQHVNKSYDGGVIISSEALSNASEYAKEIPMYHNKGFVGAYVSPTLKLGDVNVYANVEAGMAGFTDMGGVSRVAKADVPALIRDERMFDSPKSKFATNINVGADAELEKGLRGGLEVNRCSLDKSVSVLARMTYDVDRFFKSKK